MSAGSEPVSISGPAVYFDGKTSDRHEVTVEVAASALTIRSPAGDLLASWPYDEMEQSSTAEGVFRIGRSGSGDLARLEIRDPQLAAAVDDLSLPVDRTGLRERRGRRKVVAWSIVAVVSLFLVGVFGIPALATRVAPLVPYSLEQKIGDAVNEQIRGMLNPGQQGQSFECGHAPSETAGRAALDRMVARLQEHAAVPFPLKLTVVRRKEANAVALPGGYIYVFEGLITQAKSADEVAGVIAHEIGHVAHRDGTRTILQSGGLSFLFGLVLGDFIGGGAVVFAAKAILSLAYSREVEGAADAYAVELMEKAGGDPRALAEILKRIAGKEDVEIKILLNHPATKERANFIEAAAKNAPRGALITPEEWSALGKICAGS